MANKWEKELKDLKKLAGTVDFEYDSFATENCLYTPSPYFNWIFANKSNGIPKGSSILFFSENKSGKSLSIFAMISQMQKDDPEGIAIVISTEFRGQLQKDAIAGIDKDRLIIWDTNNPVEIFDRIEYDVKPKVERGLPIRILAIDSLTKIEGIKRAAADSVATHLIGDHALTVQIGLGKLIPFCRRNKLVLLATEHIRANMDAGQYGPKDKSAATRDTLHSFEYFISLKRANAAEDKQDIEGKTFTDEDKEDARGNALQTGHKVYVKCEANSIGPAGRAGIFTLKYKVGIVNQHEEIFWLGKNTGIIQTENNRTYFYKDRKFNGKKECALAIKEDSKLAESILADVKALDAQLN